MVKEENNEKVSRCMELNDFPPKRERIPAVFVATEKAVAGHAVEACMPAGRMTFGDVIAS
jgi:hypothetical protein